MERDMQYLVSGEFIEGNLAGKPTEEIFAFVETIVHPSLDSLDKMVQGGKASGGAVAGARILHMIMDASSGEDVGKMLRSLPIWGVMRWTVTPLQSFRSAIEQDKAVHERARAMGASHR
jgi:hypothetical protein